MKSKVVVIRMLSGLEVIGELISDSSSQIKLKNPMAIQFNVGQNPEQIGISMGQLAPFAKDDLETVQLNSYLTEFQYEPNDEIVENYHAFILRRKSNLILPEKGLKL
jgi:hypothetical protein